MKKSTVHRLKKSLVLLALLCAVAGCTENQQARNFGGSVKENLPAGQKLVNASWKQDNMWVLTRPMRPGEDAETYTFRESSSYGLMQGTVTLVETK